MKSIFFLMKYPTCLPETLTRKFDGQMNACIRLGYEVSYLAWNGTAFELVCKNTGEKRHVLNTVQSLPRERYYHTLYFIDMYRAAIKVLGMRTFDKLYIRFLPTFPPAVRFMKLAKKKRITIIQELPTYLGKGNDDGSVQPSFVRRVALKMCNAYARLAQRRVDLFTVIGVDADGSLYGKPAMNINNGIDVTVISLREPKPQDDAIHLLLLASMCDWHGYDRMIAALDAYRGDEKIILHFVGNDGDGSLAKWREMAQASGASEQIIFHGAVYGKELDEFIDRMDLGVSSLGMYRIGLETSTVMKGREYMARGLPFVYACDDPTIEKGQPHALQVANDDTLIDMAQVAVFARRMRASERVPENMHEYARTHMSWEMEFERILKAADGEACR